MQKFRDIEQGQGLVVLIIVVILVTSVAGAVASYTLFTPEKYAEFVKAIMIMMQAPEEMIQEFTTAFQTSLRRLDRRLYFNSQLYGGAFNFALMLFLCTFLYLGRTWARCLISLILFLGVPGALILGYVLFSTQISVTIGLYWITYAFIALIGAAILTFSAKVRAYAAYMRGA